MTSTVYLQVKIMNGNIQNHVKHTKSCSYVHFKGIT